MTRPRTWNVWGLFSGTTNVGADGQGPWRYLGAMLAEEDEGSARTKAAWMFGSKRDGFHGAPDDVKVYPGIDWY